MRIFGFGYAGNVMDRSSKLREKPTLVHLVLLKQNKRSTSPSTFLLVDVLFPGSR